MEDKEETLGFLRDCIKLWKVDLGRFIPDAGKKTRVNMMLSKAESLVKQHKLLYQYDFSIKTPMRITSKMMREITEKLNHYLTGYGAVITNRELLVEDDRKLLKTPESCKGCKWLRNGECWYNDEYYGTDFPADCDRKEKEE